MIIRAAAGCLALIAWLTGSTEPRAETARLDVVSAYPLSLPVLGDVGRRLPDAVSRATGGDFVLTFSDPATLKPRTDIVEALAQGTIQASWANAASFAQKDSAFGLFASIPFGPGQGEFLAWLYRGGGLELSREMFQARGIQNIPCGIIPPEPSGWFKREIKTTDDLKGLKMRFFGIGAKVMRKYGVIIQSLPADQILEAFQSGTLDAAEFLLPSDDKTLGFDKAAKYYYFPGWHQRVTVFELYVRKPVWDALPERSRAVLELACGDAMRDMTVDSEGLQWRTMKDMQAEGVQLKRWPLDVLLSFQNTWKEVAAEESARNRNFKRVYDSYTEFRENYAIWRQFNFLN